jgi:hypothetical protein
VGGNEGREEGWGEKRPGEEAESKEGGRERRAREQRKKGEERTEDERWKAGEGGIPAEDFIDSFSVAVRRVIRTQVCLP